MPMNLFVPSWNISAFADKRHSFKGTFGFSDFDDPKLVTFKISPYNLHSQRISIATQIQVLFDAYGNQLPTQDAFIQVLKKTRNNDPDAVQRFLWEEFTIQTFSTARHAFVIFTRLEMREVKQLAQEMMYGELSPELQVILKDTKNNPMQGFDALKGGSLSAPETFVEEKLSPFIDGILSEMLKDGSTPSSVQALADSSLAMFGGNKGGLSLEGDLLLDNVNVNISERDILIVGLGSLYITGSFTNLRSKMASIVIQLLIYNKAYDAKIYSECLKIILEDGRREGDALGRVIVIEPEEGTTRRTSLDNISLVPRIIDPSNLLAACRKEGVIGRVMNTKGKRSIMEKASSSRKEYEENPRFVALAKRVSPY